jgi:uncharacterized caspase-like protein
MRATGIPTGCPRQASTAGRVSQILVAIVFTLLAAGVSRAENRVALVIGNSAYEPGSLANPVNDAQAIAGVLRDKLGFDVVEGFDLDRKGIHRQVRSFRSKMRSGGIALFYYSGHGVETLGQNYLMPIGHDINTREDVEIEGYSLQAIVREMESAGSLLNVVLLDACRDAPLPASTRGAATAG